MQYKNAIAIVHGMVGMCNMYILYVCYLEHRLLRMFLICDLNNNKIHNSWTAIFKINFFVVS